MPEKIKPVIIPPEIVPLPGKEKQDRPSELPKTPQPPYVPPSPPYVPQPEPDIVPLPEPPKPSEILV
jgi:hypothetical protein